MNVCSEDLYNPNLIIKKKSHFWRYAYPETDCYALLYCVYRLNWKENLKTKLHTKFTIIFIKIYGILYSCSENMCLIVW